MSDKLEQARFERYAVDHPQPPVETLLPEMLASILERPIVDVGCGEGHTIAITGAIGMEISFIRASRAARYGPVLVGNAQNLPIADSSVRTLISRHVIEHVPDDIGLLREFRRVLIPGGHLYLETPLKLPGAWYPYRCNGRWVLDPTHLREYRDVAELVGRFPPGLILESVSTPPLRYPIGDLLWRAGMRRVLRIRARVPIPRYREIRLLARRS